MPKHNDPYLAEARLQQINRQGVAFGEQLADLREENAKLREHAEAEGKTLQREKLKAIDEVVRRHELAEYGDESYVNDRCSELSLVERIKVLLDGNAQLKEQLTAATARADAAIDHPSHYNKHPSGVECIDVVEHLSFCLGNAIKYLWRAGNKGPANEDLQKALWYLKRWLIATGYVNMDFHQASNDVEFREVLEKVAAHPGHASQICRYLLEQKQAGMLVQSVEQALKECA